MNKASRQTQKALSESRKGADMMNDIIMAHRKGELSEKNYYKDERGRVRVDYEQAYKTVHGASGL